MVQYYRDLWEKRSQLLTPLINLVRECGQTKTTRKNQTKRKHWHWNCYQVLLDVIKQQLQLVQEIMLDYPMTLHHVS